MFDAALSLLEGVAFAIRGHVKDREKALRDCQQIAAACLVLRAAEKVDKEKALGRVACHPCDEDYGVYGLIAALPDAPKEEK